MRANEITTVLDAISGYDGRTWTPAATEAWAAVIGRYPLADAIQAVQEHYATNEKRIMPVNIRSRCIHLGENRARAERALEAPKAPVVTEVGHEARAEIARIVGRVTARTEAAYRSAPADRTSPTDPASDITEAARREQMARLRALVNA